MKYLLYSVFTLFPSLTEAQPITAPTDFKSLVGIFIDIIEILVPFIFALALITFMWGITKAWIIKAGDEEAIDSGKKIAVVGIVVFVIMFGIWGILAILKNSFIGV